MLVGWIVLLFALAPLGSKLADVTNDQTSSFLPKNAESTKVVNLLEKQFPGGQTVNGLVVYERPGGLTTADKAKIAADAARAKSALPLVGPPAVPFRPGAPQALVAPGGAVAYTALSVPDNNKKLATWGKRLKRIVGTGTGSQHVYVTGDLGFNTDADQVFGSIDTQLLLATVVLVLVLLGLIYRSPVIAVIPLLVVGFSYAVAQGFIYLYAKSGATVSSNSTSILVVLMFGVGTDYCLLLVSRYREELRRFEDKHDAMQRAVQRAGPAILASGLTVTLSMLVLLVAESGSIHSLGPVSAIGVASVLLAGLTLLPALLTIAGRRGFWPRRRLIAYAPNEPSIARQGVWRRFGDHVLRRPGAALGITVALFVAGAFGIAAFKEDYSTTSFFKKKTESVSGFKALEKAFPAGTLAPTTVLVQRGDGPVRAADVLAAQRRLDAVRDVAAAAPTGLRSRDGRIAELNVILRSDPYKSAALGVVPRLRSAVKDVAPGVTALVGGGSAVNYDFDQATSRDIKLIVPIALAVIAVILGVLLEAIVAPLVLIGSVILSFFGTLGLSLLFIRYVVGDAGVDNSLPTFAFIFLVALGVDYTIFLMSRVREEARHHGTREGTLRALAATGPVITSAGIILAGTFSVLMTLPVTFTFDLGFMVALGILLDTFIVRTIMVPAAIELLGDRIWWPSTAQGGAHVLREGPEGPSAEPATETGPA
ncbi:MAG: putative drug exporter of the superfamily [Solirubrobacteraceae bacterium]|nr:putative drug exporter of the superfamily [Solirubrobacteraceae bacterium]